MLTRTLVVLVCVGVFGSAAMAVIIETVPVGNVGNADDTHGDGHGAVDYEYNIGTYEVTAGQYTEFLNAVAATDTYGLYITSMWSTTYGCNIERSGSSGSYSYSVAADWANRPVNHVSFWDACRFANWLHNGQGNGDTETGAYTLTPDGITNNTIIRNAGWRWAITSEDEWYKAAYHKNDGDTGNYFDYPTSSDTAPSNDLVNPDPGNNATFDDGDYTIGSPYWRTEVGAHENSASPYDTFDQGGNVWEWNEAILSGGAERGLRGGSFYYNVGTLLASSRHDTFPSSGGYLIGFRVSEVPEPASIAILVLGGLALLRRRMLPDDWC